MKWRRIRRYFLICVGIAAAAFCIISWLVAGSLVASANRTVGPPPNDLPIASTTIDSESGSTLATWYIPCQESRATIVLLHPIRSDRRTMLGRARLLYDAGYSIVMIDLQAHGESQGESITVGHLEKHDARAAIEYARQMNPGHRIGVIGWSLGGASSLLASPLEIDALVLESVYPTVTEAVYDRIEMRVGVLKYVLAPALLFQLRLRMGIAAEDLRPIDFIDDVNCPVLVASGDSDQHTPLDETIQLFEAAREPKTLVIFNGAAHQDLLKFDKSKYEAEILGFLRSTLLNKNDRPHLAK